MTDPTLPRRAIAPVPPRPGMLRAIRAEARRRRLRRLQVAGATGTTTLLVVALLALTNRTSTVGLEPVSPVVDAVSPSATPAPASSAVALAEPAAPSTDVPSRPEPRHPVVSPAAGGQSAAPAVPRPAPAPSRRDVPDSTGPAIVRSERDAGVTAPCTAGAAVPAWCLAAVVDEGAGGERSTLQLTICPTDRTADRTLTFARSVETRFVISHGAAQVWSSSDGTGAVHQHAVTVTAGRCVVWALEWDQTDSAGVLVEPGDYDLTATSYAGEVADAPTSTTTFTVGGA